MTSSHWECACTSEPAAGCFMLLPELPRIGFLVTSSHWGVPVRVSRLLDALLASKAAH